ncbi:hypothetical protein NDI76_00585 [Halogeometricum sp. S1BR25-6]|uniref:Uncharacterized protein n=1 Tax=Halogeometricum salsisoli TaxID=2950536 RepID=A0ABU2G8W2_9EURY|nr:hypothetical protein [Halogeometricum sp. S1BR25-6]MDS0297236.1 hypothetical protein [Halogeometricum sp. S1BR25-6]
MYLVLDDLVRSIIAYKDLVVPFFFGLFFLGTFAAAFFYRHRYVRSSYLAVFFACLLLVNLSPSGYEIRPMEDLHKFTGIPSEEKVNYLIYVEDSAGREIRLDRRVVPTVSPNDDVARALAYCSREESEAAGRYLLHRSHEYRERIEAGAPSLVERVDFPRHQQDYRWTESELDGYGEFVTLKVYALHLHFEEGGYELTSTERELAFEVSLPANATASDVEYTFEERCL